MLFIFAAFDTSVILQYYSVYNILSNVWEIVLDIYCTKDEVHKHYYFSCSVKIVWLGNTVARTGRETIIVFEKRRLTDTEQEIFKYYIVFYY